MGWRLAGPTTPKPSMLLFGGHMVCDVHCARVALCPASGSRRVNAFVFCMLPEA